MTPAAGQENDSYHQAKQEYADVGEAVELRKHGI